MFVMGGVSAAVGARFRPVDGLRFRGWIIRRAVVIIVQDVPPCFDCNVL